MNTSMRDLESGSEAPLVPATYLRTMQIIGGALIAGVSSFFALVLFLRFGQAHPPGAAQAALPMVTFVFCVFWLAAVTMSFIVPRVMTRQAVRQILTGTWSAPQGQPLPTDTVIAKLLIVRQTTLIVGLALLEGAGFFGCIAFLLEGNPVALALLLTLLALMVLRFPTEQRIRTWLESQAAAIVELRQSGEFPAE